MKTFDNTFCAPLFKSTGVFFILFFYLMKNGKNASSRVYCLRHIVSLDVLCRLFVSVIVWVCFENQCVELLLFLDLQFTHHRPLPVEYVSLPKMFSVSMKGNFSMTLLLIFT